MRKAYGNRDIRAFAAGILEMDDKLATYEQSYPQMEMKAAMYKAGFFREFDLQKALQDQIEENTKAMIGEFDGFCYDSSRRDAVFRSLEDMYADGLLTEDQYKSCRNI